jgi:hypothetical protein
MPFGVRDIFMLRILIPSLKYVSIFADVFVSTINSRNPNEEAGPDTFMMYLKLKFSIFFPSTSFSIAIGSIHSASNVASVECSRGGIGSNPNSILRRNHFV